MQIHGLWTKGFILQFNGNPFFMVSHWGDLFVVLKRMCFWRTFTFLEAKPSYQGACLWTGTRTTHFSLLFKSAIAVRVKLESLCRELQRQNKVLMVRSIAYLINVLYILRRGIASPKPHFQPWYKSNLFLVVYTPFDWWISVLVV